MMNHRGGEAGRQKEKIRGIQVYQNQEKVRRETEFLVFNKGNEMRDREKMKRWRQLGKS